MVDVATARLALVGGGNALLDESGSAILDEAGAPITAEDADSTISLASGNVGPSVIQLTVTPQQASVTTGVSTTVDASTARVFLTLNNDPLVDESGRQLLDEAGNPILSEDGGGASIANDVNVNAAVEALSVSTFDATIGGAGTNIGAGVELLTITPQPATIARPTVISANVETLNLTTQAAAITTGAATNVNATPARLYMLPGIDGILDEAGFQLLDESGEPIVAEYQRRATIGSTEAIIAGPALLSITTNAATIPFGTDTTVNANTETLDISEKVAGVSRGPYIQGTLFTDATDSWEITSEDGTGNIVWAITTSGAAAPVPDGIGGWTGTVIDSGSDAFTTNISIATNGTPGTVYDFYVYQRTSGGLDSNVIVQSYTENVNTNLEALAITTFPASLSPSGITTNLEQLALTTNAATIRSNVNVAGNVEGLSLATFSATIATGTNVSVNTEQLAIATQQATISDDVEVSTSPVSLRVTTQDASISASGVVFAQPEQLTITPQAASVVYLPSVTYTSVALTFTAFAADVAGVRVNGVEPKDSVLTGRLANSNTLTGELQSGTLIGKIANG